MKKTLALLLSLLLFASSCSLPGIRPITTDVPDMDTDTETVTDPETELTETEIDIDPPVSQTDKNEKPARSLITPTSYEQVYEKLTATAVRSYSDGNYYYAADAVEEEAVMEAPASFEENVSVKADAADFSVADDYSKTNAQVDDIDEGDIVKTDGENIYVLKSSGDLVILSAAGADMEVLSVTHLVIDSGDSYREEKNESSYYYFSHYQYAVELYVENDTVAVVLNDNSWSENYDGKDWTYENNTRTIVDLYDVTDPTNPAKLASLGQDGSYSASRLMDGELYLITRYYVYEQNDEDDYDDYIPRLYTNDVAELMPVESIVCPENLDSTCYTVVSRYSVGDGRREASLTVLGAGDTVYMNGEHLFLAGSTYYNDVTDEMSESVYTVRHYESGNRTEIYKINVTGELSVSASGIADGYLLNQFALDEYDGHLRVVTTVSKNSYRTFTDEAYGFTNYQYDDFKEYNELTVFDEEMNAVGGLTNLAEDERVYSVRFDGNVGYFVTFRQVDPLFSVDLSDPAGPTIMGELKIPGFSTYLHPYSDTLLFGFGQNADEESGRTTGMKLSMFDVSDPYDVVEKDKYLLGDSYSPALYNHKAILVSPERGYIGFPTEKGFALYTYDEDDGFRPLTEITFTDEYWWYGDTRGLYVGDTVYFVSDTKAVAYDGSTFDILARVNY